MFQCRYIGYFPFNRIQFVSYQPRHAPLSHPFYHYPLFYSLSHSSLHFLKHLCIFIRKKWFFFSCSVHSCFSKLRRRGIVIQFVSVLLSNNAELFWKMKNEDKICIKIYLYVYTLIIMAGVWWAITCTKCYEVYIYQLCNKI